MRFWLLHSFVKRICFYFTNIDFMKYILHFFTFGICLYSVVLQLWIPYCKNRVWTNTKCLFSYEKDCITTDQIMFYLHICYVVSYFKKIRSMSLRCDDLSIMIVNDLLNNNIHSPATIYKLNLNVPHRQLGNSEILKIPFGRTSCGLFKLITRMFLVLNTSFFFLIRIIGKDWHNCVCSCFVFNTL